MNNNEINESWVMTGTEAKKYVQKLKNNPSKYGSVSINMYLACQHVERTEDNGFYEEDLYGGNEWNLPLNSIELRWKDFLKVCDEADKFSALKQARFEDNGDDNTAAELGTGISIRSHTNEYYRYTIVTIG